MNAKQRLISILAGAAMLAMPVAAAARNHGRAVGPKPRAAHEFRVARPARGFAPRVNFGRGRAFVPPVAFRRARIRRAGRFERWNNGFRRGYWGEPDSDDYGYNGYWSEPDDDDDGYNGYNNWQAAPFAGYGAPYYGSACGNAQRVLNQAIRDRRTGHPAAAAAILRNRSIAIRRCRSGQLGSGGYGAPYGYGGAPSMLAPFVQRFLP